MHSTKLNCLALFLASLMVATQVPVSIADLGGTEIDLRFANPKQGRLFVIVAPCKRFSDSKFLSSSCLSSNFQLPTSMLYTVF